MSIEFELAMEYARKAVRTPSGLVAFGKPGSKASDYAVLWIARAYLDGQTSKDAANGIYCATTKES